MQDLQSIFEITHLRKTAVFLDTQCMSWGLFFFQHAKRLLDRMPPQIGSIISDAVYDNKLKSNPKHPITDDIIACRFINVSGKEKMLPTNSFMVFDLFLFFALNCS